MYGASFNGFVNCISFHVQGKSVLLTKTWDKHIGTMRNFGDKHMHFSGIVTEYTLNIAGRIVASSLAACIFLYEQLMKNCRVSKWSLGDQ